MFWRLTAGLLATAMLLAIEGCGSGEDEAATDRAVLGLPPEDPTCPNHPAGEDGSGGGGYTDDCPKMFNTCFVHIPGQPFMCKNSPGEYGAIVTDAQNRSWCSITSPGLPIQPRQPCFDDFGNPTTTPYHVKCCLRLYGCSW